MIITDPVAIPGQAVTIVNTRSRSGHLIEGVVSSASYWVDRSGAGRWTYDVTCLASTGRYVTARVLRDDCIRAGGMTAAEKEESK